MRLLSCLKSVFSPWSWLDLMIRNPDTLGQRPQSLGSFFTESGGGGSLDCVIWDDRFEHRKEAL